MAKRKDATDTPEKDKDGKRKKVPTACLFCRRSHMVCSSGRPCERCVRRGISHLCTTESDSQPLNGGGGPSNSSAASNTATTVAGLTNGGGTKEGEGGTGSGSSSSGSGESGSDEGGETQALPSAKQQQHQQQQPDLRPQHPPVGAHLSLSVAKANSASLASFGSPPHPSPAAPASVARDPSPHPTRSTSTHSTSLPPPPLAVAAPASASAYAHPSPYPSQANPVSIATSAQQQHPHHHSTFSHPPTSTPRSQPPPPSHLLSLAATPTAPTPIHSPSWPALPPSFGLESISSHPLLSTATHPNADHAPSAEWASLSSFIDSLDFPPGLFTPDVRSPAPSGPGGGGPDDGPAAAGAGGETGADREAYALFLEQLRLKQTQLAASRPGSPRTQAFTHASSSFLQLPPQFAPSPAAAAASPGAAGAGAGVVPSKREFMELLQAQFEGAQLATKGDLWDWEGGWKALDVWLQTCSEKNRERVHAPLRIFRPTVREILAGMSDEDKMLVEEGFQRLMLQYDRVFTVVKTPSCLWRRTGQIFKANAEFAALMGMELSWFRDGKLGVYELMTEEAGVNFWEQYCGIGFDQSRKAVLTTCTLTPPARLLKRKPKPSGHASSSGSGGGGRQINCCFSFTVTRDGWGVPMGIMGNFLQIGG